MPVIEHEPTFGELVDNAAEKRVQDINEWNSVIYRLYGERYDPITAYIREKWFPDDFEPISMSDTQIKIQPTPLLRFSSFIYILLNGFVMLIPKYLAICCTLLTLIFRLSDRDLQDRTNEFSNFLDVFLNIYFLFEGILRLFTIPALLYSRQMQKQQIASLPYEILRSGWIEILISICSLIVVNKFDNSNAICWLNLFRLAFITKFYLAELPEVEVLLSGIMSGLRSVLSVWFLLMVCFIIYGVLTTSYFRKNDPAHFSTVGTSIFTLFRISTMDNWANINYINSYGCDSVLSEYVVISKGDPTHRYVDVFSGRMYLFLCDDPRALPYSSSIIFTSFVVLTGFVLISLTVAAVSTGMKIRLHEIQKFTAEKKIELNQYHQMDLSLFLEKIQSEEADELGTDLVRGSSMVGIVPNKISTAESLAKMQLGPQQSQKNGSRRGSVSLSFIPILQDKKLIRRICKQMWNDVEITRTKRKELQKEISQSGSGRELSSNTTESSSHSIAHKHRPIQSKLTIRPSFARLTQKLQTISLVNNRKGKPNTRATQLLSFRSKQISIHKLIKEYNVDDIFVSKQNFYLFVRNILASPWYLYYLIFIILTTASCQIYCVNKDNCPDFTYVFLTIQIFLTIDVVVKVISYYPMPRDYFTTLKNNFDFCIVTLIWVPFFYTGFGSSIAETARIVYLIRLIPLLSWIVDLQVIFLALESSVRPLVSVVGIMFIFFFHFAVAGVLIFKQNDEFYFGTLYRAMNSLFQVCTLDSWGNIALKNMYGCDLYGSNTGMEKVDEMCDNPLGLGWIAAWYFIIFITLSVMILHSLFVGIIISAMELLKDSVNKEADMWKLVYLRVSKYGLQNSTLMNLLDIFNAIDGEKTGLITKKELDLVLKYLPTVNLTTVLKQVKCQTSGQYNFPEFIDFIHFVGVNGKIYKQLGSVGKMTSLYQLRNEQTSKRFSQTINTPELLSTSLKVVTEVQEF